jgi:endo-1,4-beta-xylanase
VGKKYSSHKEHKEHKATQRRIKLSGLCASVGEKNKTKMKKLLFIGLITLVACAATKQDGSTEEAKKDSLYKAYQSYFPIGTAINPDVDLASEDRKKFIAKHYNSVTAENQMKLKFIHPQKDKWNWTPADDIVTFARANKMKIRGHALIWQQNVPLWFIMNNGSFVTKEELYKNMKEHIDAMMNRYKADVYCWDVVNEAISDAPKDFFKEKDTLYKIAGEEYVEMAFRYARAADPKAQLFYNDYRFSDSTKRRKIFELLKRLKAKGTPIDGVGMQSHYTPNEVTREYLQETIDMFAGIGLKVQITELDVSVYNYRDKNGPDVNKADDVYTDTRKKTQEDFYTMLFDVYRKNKSKINGVTFWGSSDMRKNYRTNRIGKMDYPFLFDEFMKPKPVFNKIKVSNCFNKQYGFYYNCYCTNYICRKWCLEQYSNMGWWCCTNIYG